MFEAFSTASKLSVSRSVMCVAVNVGGDTDRLMVVAGSSVTKERDCDPVLLSFVAVQLRMKVPTVVGAVKLMM